MTGLAFPLRGYAIDQRRHAIAILTSDYPDALDQLLGALSSLQITHAQIIAGGGGKSQITQALEAPLKAAGWDDKTFEMTQTIDGVEIESNTHEIDHFRAFDDGRPGIALEIEWNNKDPFFDRDLATFARLHLIGVISVGIIVTRGPSLRAALRSAFDSAYRQMPTPALDAEIATIKQTKIRAGLVKIGDRDQRAAALARLRYSSKYGEATTHWTKLMDRVHRGLGNPCPLLLLGIEADRLHP